MKRQDWNERYAERGLLWTAEPNRFLVEEVGALAPGAALDLACGEGRNAVWLAERGWRVTGVDFSDVAVAKAARLAAGRGVEGEWVCADLLAFTPAPSAYDLVVVFYLQVPAAQRERIMRAAAGGVAPDGTLLIVAHDSANLRDGYGGPQEASVLYTAEEVVADLSGSGLVIERAARVERPVETADGPRIALDALILARSVTSARGSDSPRPR
jgi:SAM-dependent methyltransferase